MVVCKMDMLKTEIADHELAVDNSVTPEAAVRK